MRAVCNEISKQHLSLYVQKAGGPQKHFKSRHTHAKTLFGPHIHWGPTAIGRVDPSNLKGPMKMSQYKDHGSIFKSSKHKGPLETPCFRAWYICILATAIKAPVAFLAGCLFVILCTVRKATMKKYIILLYVTLLTLSIGRLVQKKVG